MKFKTHKIRKTTNSQNFKETIENTINTETIKTKKQEKNETKSNSKKQKITIILTLIGLLAAIFILITAIVKIIKQFDFGQIIEIAGKELKVDANNNTQFLILGKGGLNHDGGDLTDTILLTSINHDTKEVTLFSIPRDLYIQDTLVGSSKINEVYFYAKRFYGSSAQGLEHLKTKVQELTNLEIHYYFIADFKGFKEIVDAVGGIEVEVEEAIYDPYYPKDGTYEYETFSISEGIQHLDGETALKYARSRKTTSDFDRAKRQQDIIYALKEKALQTEIILSTEKINEILNILKSNIETDLEVKEMLTLGSIATDFTKDSFSHYVIHDDGSQCGGLLYPPRQELYNNQYVLLPAGGNKFIEMFSNLHFNYSNTETENTLIHILNSTKYAGIAGETKQILKRFCIYSNRFGNGQNQELQETTYYYDINKGRPVLLDYLKTIIPGKEETVIPDSYKEYLLETDIILDIGYDYTDSENYINDPFYYMVDYTNVSNDESSE